MGLYDQNQSSQDALRKLREGASHSRVAQEIAQRDYAKAQAEADKWEQEYQLAVQGSNQNLINQVKFQKERYQAIASRLKKLVGEQQPQVDAIKISLKSWEQKVSEAQNEVLSSKPSNSEFSPTFIKLEHEDIDVWVDDELQQLKALMLSPKPQEQTKAKKDRKVLLAEAINETKKAVNSAVANQEGIERDFEKAQKETKYWNEKVQDALKNNDDDLALQAVVNKKVQNKIVLILLTQLQQQQATVAVLRQNLMTLENFKKTLGSDTKL
ncbi:PspA/IM30 family protein [Nostoc sphaeroides CHAB 2801]|uniref:PspA/IM30 family protein n=1 Tax=Nostoc sphaeroides TaxID=446679 RepID=UPI000E5482DF|nr:PspA/IM30 family protein [Nostoc sphaeroides]MCC5630284.1 PspA/IM30 family protein [Nostoc sphaeroides CHAB 2801]